MPKREGRNTQLYAGFFAALMALGTMAASGAQQTQKTASTIQELLDADQKDRQGAMSLTKCWRPER
ncbi:MAG TPA: hypothetical protein VGS59_07965 [Candidatus Acidoferrales bacterium]|nr:hypothetical protein [Candidatus Acidoferrales bacterium]